MSDCGDLNLLKIAYQDDIGGDVLGAAGRFLIGFFATDVHDEALIAY